MDVKDKYYICVFDSKNKAIYLHSILDKTGNKNFQLISTPCRIKAGCNYSIKFMHISHLQTIKRKAEELNLGKYRVFHVENINRNFKYEEIKF